VTRVSILRRGRRERMCAGTGISLDETGLQESPSADCRPIGHHFCPPRDTPDEGYLEEPLNGGGLKSGLKPDTGGHGGAAERIRKRCSDNHGIHEKASFADDRFGTWSPNCRAGTEIRRPIFAGAKRGGPSFRVVLTFVGGADRGSVGMGRPKGRGIGKKSIFFP